MGIGKQRKSLRKRPHLIGKILTLKIIPQKAKRDRTSSDGNRDILDTNTRMTCHCFTFFCGGISNRMNHPNTS
ncbi:unnamed protein product [Calypogeia fissa]